MTAKRKQKIRCENGEAEIIKELERGGFGVVYLATYSGTPVALKLLKQTKLRPYIGENIKRLLNGPSLDRRIAQPIDLVKSGDGQIAGYVMQYFDLEKYVELFHCLEEVVTVRDTQKTFSLQNRLLVAITKVFLARHVHGEHLVYLDDSLANGLADVATGRFRLIDPDNLSSPDHHPDSSLCPITPGFGDPLILLGKTRPCIESDLFSLAVVLYHLILRDSPWSGKRTNVVITPEKAREFARTPIFHFDPKNTSNRATAETAPAAKELWPCIPKALRDTFIQALGPGVTQPSARVRETEWLTVFEELSDAVVRCSSCTAEYFDQQHSPTTTCPGCNSTRSARCLIGRRKKRVSAYPGKKLFAHHTGGRPHQYEVPTGEFFEKQHRGESVIGIRNLSKSPWVVQKRGIDGQLLLHPGKAVALRCGQKISFDSETSWHVS